VAAERPRKARGSGSRTEGKDGPSEREVTMTIINQEKARDGQPFRRVWIKAFWGFDPESE
jgi:hypothetical protein